jgi:hypothetical protein
MTVFSDKGSKVGGAMGRVEKFTGAQASNNPMTSRIAGIR